MSNPIEMLKQLDAEKTARSGINRRSLLSRAGLVGAAALGAGLLGDSTPSAEAAQAAVFGARGARIRLNDADILNFALNLEYLEAEFYQRAAFGVGIPATLTGPGGARGTGTPGTVSGPTTAITFSSSDVRQYATEIATDELNHVTFLRTALGRFAVAEPSIDVSDAAFTAAANAAGIVGAFSPYTGGDAAFLLGAFVFEDVGVTAYHGAAPFIRNPTYLSAAAGILAVEAYHASEVRLQLLQAGSPFVGYANQIAALRDAASAAIDGVDPTDQGISSADGTLNIVPTDVNSIAFARSFGSVLNIVYLGTAATTGRGGFYPNGMNGRITTLVPPVRGRAR